MDFFFECFYVVIVVVTENTIDIFPKGKSMSLDDNININDNNNYDLVFWDKLYVSQEDNQQAILSKKITHTNRSWITL